MASVNAEKYHYGIDAEIQNKLNSKFSQEDAATALAWIASLAGASVAPNANFHETLKSGVLLCKAANALSPNAIKRINNMSMPFMMRENIVAYLDFCKSWNVQSLFVAQDLFEGDNLVAVIDNIFALSGVAQARGFKGPSIGVRQSASSTKEKRFEVSSTGSSVPSWQTSGSKKTDTSTTAASYHSNIVKTFATASNVPSQQNAGSKNTSSTPSNVSYHTSIVRK